MYIFPEGRIKFLHFQQNINTKKNTLNPRIKKLTGNTDATKIFICSQEADLELKLDSTSQDHRYCRLKSVMWVKTEGLYNITSASEGESVADLLSSLP